jgi:LexA-binding, inner membrane-associated putative hydrolase
MASYRGHLAFASLLGVAYGGAGWLRFDFDWGPVCLAAGVTTLGGLLPDLDSDSGVPVRETFGLAAAVVPLMLHRRLERACGLSPEQTLVLLGFIYLGIRYGMAQVFRHITVHRGMFHSIPGMLVAGLALYLIYHSDQFWQRVYLAVGVMLGFLSHLVLDELYSVDFMGLRVRLNKYAGSAMKFVSPSWPATLIAYGILTGLSVAAWYDFLRSYPGR